MLWYQDEPVHTMTALVSFQLMRATAMHGIKVILNGQGGDETLAGYPNFFRNRWHDIAATRGMDAARGEMRAYAAAHGRRLQSLTRELHVRRVLRYLNELRAYRAVIAARRRARLGRGWYTADLLAHLPERAVAPAHLDGALEYSQTVTPLPLYLRLEDRNAMAHSIEARLPFLDHRLVEFAHALPGEWKLSGALNKFILRESMRGRIPESVRARVDKMGFPVPARQWFREQLFEPLMDLFAGSSSIGLVRRDAVERDVARYRAGDIDITDSLFELAQFTLWHAGVPPVTPAPRATGSSGATRPITAGQTQFT
jgi:asparagine synthase (glutamine-hydrolysing)